MTDFKPLSLSALSAAYAVGAADPVQVTEAALAEISARNPTLNAFTVVDNAGAMAAAKAASDRQRRGLAIGPLDGAPVAIKDNFDVAGAQNANGCAFGPVATMDAEAVRRLKQAGCVILGRLNQHELALGATTDNPHWGQAHNPKRQGFTPGGSSGGSGAAVAAGLAPLTLGTDTMGSVRIPAAFCGIWGLKPTYGLISTRGVSPLAWTLDHVGPLTAAAEDLGLALEVLAGFDAASPDSRRVLLDRRPFQIEGLRVGRVRNVDAAEMSDDVRQAWEAFLAALEGAGAEIVDVEWQGLDFGRARRAGLLISETQSAHAYAEDLAERPERFSDEIRAMLEYGGRAPAAKLAAAERTVAEAARLVRNSMAGVDVIAMPTAPMPPFAFADAPPANQADFAAPANFAGAPALALPFAESGDGLPIGMQLMAPPGQDFRLTGLAPRLQWPNWHRLDRNVGASDNLGNLGSGP